MDVPVEGTRPNPSPGIRLIDFNDFRLLEEFPRYPDNEGLAHSLHDIDIDNSFIVFISHCWLRGWHGAPGYSGRPHPDNATHDKFCLCITGIEKMIENFAFQLEHCYVWLDFGCINQNIDPAGELKQLDDIVRCCDCIFTPIVDEDDWALVHTPEGFFVDYKAKAWNAEGYGYLNRGWCRLEMFYAANIPVRPSPKSELFTAGLRFATQAGRRPHVLYGSREERNDSQPIVLDPLQNSYFEKYHPMKGSLSVADDCHKIESLVQVLLPYMTFSRAHYEGDSDSEGRHHGHGTLTFDDGNIYIGQFRAGVMSGIGEYLFSNGDRYDGDFKADLRCGYGVFSFANGNTYAGDFLNGKYDGYGTYTFANGDVYIGEWRDGKKHGYGVFTCVSGFNYDGEWRYDKRDGFASFISSNGDVYNGNFRDNLEEGFGVYCSGGGDQYEGQFVAGKKHGFGSFSYTDGDKYEGDFENDQVQGEGRFRYFNEDTYVGSVVAGCYEGKGVYSYADGRKYEGQYRCNLKHGEGTFYFGHGNDRVVGMFADDTCCGPAVVYVGGHEEAVVFESMQVSSLIAKYYPHVEEVSETAEFELVPALPAAQRVSSSRTMNTRNLVQTSKGLRYYCGTSIDGMDFRFENGDRRWCKNTEECDCASVCGPLLGCQCTDCYQMSFPPELPLQPTVDAGGDEETTCSAPTVSASSSPALVSKWGRVRMALLTKKGSDQDIDNPLPPPPSLLSTRSSRIPSSNNITGRSSITKVHIPSLADLHLEGGEGDVRDVPVSSFSLGPPSDDGLDLDDLPPPPPSLISTKSRSSHSFSGNKTSGIAAIGSKWNTLRANLSSIPKIEACADKDNFDDIDDSTPPPMSLLSARSISSVSVAASSRAHSAANEYHIRRASSSLFELGIGYRGGMEDGLFEGFGELVYKGGAKYAGSYTHGVRSGEGTFTYSLLSSFTGSYLNGKRHGRGRMDFPNGSFFEGTYVNGSREGVGVFVYADGGKYEGAFSGDMYNGEAVHTMPNGCTYTGRFRNGRRHGRGVFSFKNRTCVFEGDFNDGNFVEGSVVTSKGLRRQITL